MDTQTQTASREDSIELAQPREVADRVRNTIYQATLVLDAQRWQEWLTLCDEDFTYEIKSWSPEINYDVTYMHASRKDWEHLIELLPKHNTDHSPLTRHTSVYSVDVSNDSINATAISAFVVYRHILDSGENSHVEAGESRLFLVGKYYDEFRIGNGQPRFVNRVVRLENRRLDGGSHWPI